MQAQSRPSASSRKRHIPTKHSHIYYSVRANGSKVFEVRHPEDADKRRRYEVVGPSLAAAKARAHEVHGAGAPKVVSLSVTFEEVVKDWRETRAHLRPASEHRYDGILDRHVLPRLGRTKVKDIDNRTIRRVLADAP